jgi:hypothetical protein
MYYEQGKEGGFATGGWRGVRRTRYLHGAPTSTLIASPENPGRGRQCSGGACRKPAPPALWRCLTVKGTMAKLRKTSIHQLVRRTK